MAHHPAIWKRFSFPFISLTIILAALSPLGGAPQVAHATGTYVVDATLDAPDVANNGVCDDGVGDCTLRAAIQEAFDDIAPTTITFASGLAGQTFVLTDTYGVLLWAGDNITVTGESKNITISGADLGAGKSIFKIEGSHNTLKNLTVKQAPQDRVQIGDFEGLGAGNDNKLDNVTLLQNGASGVYVFGASDGGQFNTIQNSRIGLSNLGTCGSGNGTGVYIDQGATGTIVTVNNISCNTNDGVDIVSSTNVEVAGNHIGLSTSLGNGGNGAYAIGTTGLRFDGNTISGNALNGILLINAGTTGVYGNLIGTDGIGTVAVPNGGNGIELLGNTDHSIIGGSAFAGNFISGNSLSGILMDGSGSHDNTVIGNKIGTDHSGSAAIANGQNGVRLQNGTHNNTIGGHGTTDVRNIISGNTLDGILLLSGATQNYIDGNFLGLGANGLTVIPNGLGGVALINAPNNGIGSAFASTSQYISGNALQGIYVSSSDNTFIGQSNSIGVAADNVSPRVNGLQGVLINESINSSVFAHAVLYNGGSGVSVTGIDSQNDKIVPTYVAFNGGLPIDLGEDGATANDPGDGDGGPNTLLNYPVITSYAGTVITGTACTNCTVFIYNAYGNPAGASGGGYLVQNVVANGAGQWTAPLIGGLHHQDVSLVACQSPCSLAANTSEMSPRPILYLPLMQR